MAINKAVRAVTFESGLDSAIQYFQMDLVGTNSQYAVLDTATRLQALTGMILGEKDDYSADTGAISGSNAGGSVVKNAADIVPESGDLSTATLPEQGSNSQITYTGDDGKSFTFNVKWLDSFTKFVSGTSVNDSQDVTARLMDSRYLVDLNDFDENELFYQDSPKLSEALGNPTYGDMKNYALTTLKGLNTYWLKEWAKLIYDSYGLDFDGKTIEVKLTQQGQFMSSCFTTAKMNNDLPNDNAVIGFIISNLDENNPNGLLTYADGHIEQFFDRVVAHEMVHAAMMIQGLTKFLPAPYASTPRYFLEGVADLVVGIDDYNAGYNNENSQMIKNLLEDPDMLNDALRDTPYNQNGAYYVAGYMFLRYLAKQALDKNIYVLTDENQNDSINFDGSNHTIITNYDSSKVINYGTDFLSANVSGTYNDFLVLNSSHEFLYMRDVRGEMMNFQVGSDGKAYAYMAEGAGEVDGRTFDDGNSFEVIFGANNADNVIRAGNGGSQLWGGYLGNDELYGGSERDMFTYEINSGNDTIHDAESQDIVILRSIDLSQITSAEILDNGVNFSVSYGGTLKVEGTPENFLLEDSDNIYSADYENKTWTQKN